MILQRLFARKPNPAQRLYEAIVAAARQPKFYADMAVPDTLDGRFDMIVLHMYLVLERLRGVSEPFRQTLTNTFFKDMDRSLREMGVGDLSVSKKIRPMAEAFHGRMLAYHQALGQGEDALMKALQRNVYAGRDEPKAADLAQWVKTAKTALQANANEALLTGDLNLP